MGDTIRKFKIFPFYDYPGVEQYLEEMALQGWMLEKRSLGQWKFRKIEPQLLHYEVVFAQWEKQRPSERETQRQRIASGEWEKVCSWQGGMIYRSAQQTPCSIGGDAAERLESMHRFKGCTMQANAIVMMFFALLMLYLNLKDVFNNPVYQLSLDTSLSIILLCFLFIVSILKEYIEYRCWKRKADKAVQYPSATVYNQNGTLQVVVNGVVTFLLIAAVLYGLAAQKENWDSYQYSQREPDTVVMLGGMPCSVYTDFMLLTADQLGFVTEDVAYSQQVKESETFLIKRTLAKQEAAGFSTAIYHDRRPPEISYELVDVKAGFLYDACRASVENRLITHVRQGHLYNSILQSAVDDFAPTTLEAQYSKVDAVSDDLAEVYRMEHQENDDAYGYLFLWEERIAAVCMTYEANEEQLAIMIDAMKIHPLVAQ